MTKTMTTNRTGQQLTIRLAIPTDRAALKRLAQLDSAAPLGDAQALVAELDEELVAALPLDGRGAIANPFRQSAGIVALLEARAAELASAPMPSPRRQLSRALRFSFAGRA